MSGFRPVVIAIAFTVGPAALGTAAASSSAPRIVDSTSEVAAGPVRTHGPAIVDTSADEACARKVKVVYAGYGEAQRAACGTLTR